MLFVFYFFVLLCVGACCCAELWWFGVFVVVVRGVCYCDCGSCWWCPPLDRSAQNFALFSLSRHIFCSFLPLLLVFSLNFGGFEAPVRSSVHVRALGLSCEAPNPPGLHTTTRELQTCTFERTGASNTTKIPRKRPTREGEKNKNCGGKGKKKREILGPHRSGPHPFGTPPPPFGPPPFRAPILRSPTLRGPTMTHTRSQNRYVQHWIGQNWIGQNWLWPKLALAVKTTMAKNGLAKIGSAKVGPFPIASTVHNCVIDAVIIPTKRGRNRMLIALVPAPAEPVERAWM